MSPAVLLRSGLLYTWKCKCLLHMLISLWIYLVHMIRIFFIKFVSTYIPTVSESGHPFLSQPCQYVLLFKILCHSDWRVVPTVPWWLVVLLIVFMSMLAIHISSLPIILLIPLSFFFLSWIVNSWVFWAAYIVFCIQVLCQRHIFQIVSSILLPVFSLHCFLCYAKAF